MSKDQGGLQFRRRSTQFERRLAQNKVMTDRNPDLCIRAGPTPSLTRRAYVSRQVTGEVKPREHWSNFPHSIVGVTIWRNHFRKTIQDPGATLSTIATLFGDEGG
jgi:hypothetical protein